MDEHAAELRRCLEDGDVQGLRRLHNAAFSHLPSLRSDAEALISLHYARTLNRTFRMRKRAYSHRWLIDNGYPSALPDHLRPRAERMYPRQAMGVAIGVHIGSPLFKPIQPLIIGAMQRAVLETHGDGVALDDPLIKQRMFEAKDKEMKALVGRLTTRGIE